jgi:hypothetical protein
MDKMRHVRLPLAWDPLAIEHVERVRRDSVRMSASKVTEHLELGLHLGVLARRDERRVTHPPARAPTHRETDHVGSGA